MSTEGCHPSAFHDIMKRGSLAAALGGTVRDGGLTRTCLFYNPHKINGASYTHVFTGAVGYLGPATSKRTYGRYRSYGTFGRRHSCGVRRLSTTSGGSISSVHTLVSRIHVPPPVKGCGIFVVSRIRVLDSTTFGTFLGALRRPPRRTLFVLTAARGRGILPAVLSHYRVCSFSHVSVTSVIRRLRCMSSYRKIATRPRTLGIVTRGTSNNVHSTLSVFSRMIDFAGKGVACRTIVSGLGILSCRCCFQLASTVLSKGIQSTVLVLGSVLDGKFSKRGVVANLTSRFHSLLIYGSRTALVLFRINTSVHRHCGRVTGHYSSKLLFGTVRLTGAYSLGCQTDQGGHLLLRLALVRLYRLDDTKRPTSSGGGKLVRPVTSGKPNRTPTRTNRTITTRRACAMRSTPPLRHPMRSPRRVAKTAPHRRIISARIPPSPALVPRTPPTSTPGEITHPPRFNASVGRVNMRRPGTRTTARATAIMRRVRDPFDRRTLIRC